MIGYRFIFRCSSLINPNTFKKVVGFLEQQHDHTFRRCVLQNNFLRHLATEKDINNIVNKFSEITDVELTKYTKFTDFENATSNYLENLKRNLKICADYKISNKTLKENEWILKLEPKILERNFHLLSNMYLKDINHGIPFLSLSEKNLQKILNYIALDAKNKSFKKINRLYYISEKIKTDPSIVAQYISKRIFIYTTKFEKLEKNLNTLLEYNIDAQYILNDLWVLRCDPNSTRQRLEMFKSSGRSILRPWMVKCPKKTLKRSIEISEEVRKLLGTNNSTLEYLADNLKCNKYTIQSMCNNTPCISNVKVSKAKEIMDTFFSEGYKHEDIINAPRIFAHSIKTLKSRLAHIQSLNINLTNLNILCKSRRDFQKYIEKMKKIYVD